MNRTKSIRHIAAACLSSVVLLEGAASAQSTIIGNLANWQANAVQAIGDKQYTYLTQSGSWNGSEIFTLTSNIPLSSNSLNVATLGSLVGPFTLSFGYELLITNTSNSFQSMSLDVNATGTTTTITKDIFDSFAAFNTGTAPGSGTWSLTLINSSSGSTVSLPPIQTVWVRDWISATPSGSILGVSNTAVQLPEPSSLALAGIAVSCGGVAYWRRRRSAGRFECAEGLRPGGGPPRDGSAHCDDAHEHAHEQVG